MSKRQDPATDPNPDKVPRLIRIRLGQEVQIRIHNVLCTVDNRYDTCWSINAIQSKQKVPQKFVKEPVVLYVLKDKLRSGWRMRFNRAPVPVIDEI